MVPMIPVSTHAKGKLVVKNPQLEQLFTLAKELGFALMPLDRLTCFTWA